ncbi:MAG: 4Fe-4S binding protein [Nitrospirae bacterium]|nr:4Fe-4S binding protein [Nitrospirota bacterium]
MNGIGIVNDLLRGDLVGGILHLVGNLPLPSVGVGGGIEAKEHVDLVPLLKFTLAFVAGVAAIFGLGLALTAKKFAVKLDPRIDEVKEVLANAHCGACGFAGCASYAEAVVMDPKVPVNLCAPGGDKCAEAVARITGKIAEKTEPKIARLFCQGGNSLSRRKFRYEGIMDCRAAVIAAGGDKSCIYGCLGYGSCERACPFNAITMSDDNLPLIDPAKCTACGKCVSTCPKMVLELGPTAAAVVISCHSKDKGPVVRKNCDIGCIGCGTCVKTCPYDAIALENNLARIDFAKCQVCGLCVSKCPTKAIHDYLPEREKAYITDKCNGCTICSKVCPVDAATGVIKEKHSINEAKCVGCGICVVKCPKKAIIGTFRASRKSPGVIEAGETVGA